jgi:hypothetical protein
LLVTVCLLFLLSSVCRSQVFTQQGSFGSLDVSPDGKIAVALKNDPVTFQPAYLTSFDPLTGAEFDSKSFGFGPMGVRLAQVGGGLRAVVLTSEGGPRRIYLFEVGSAGQLTQLASTQLTTSISDSGSLSNLVLSGAAGAGFTIVDDGIGIKTLVSFSLADGSILNRIQTPNGGPIAILETPGRRLLAFGDSDKFAFVDATDPAHLSPAGTVALPRNGSSSIAGASIAFSADARYVFVSNEFIDLSAIDLTTMQVVGTVSGNPPFGRLRLFDDGQRRVLAVVSTRVGAGGQSGILLVDATDPAHMSVLKQLDTIFMSRPDMAFSHTGERLFVTDSGKLFAFDLPSATKAWEQQIAISATNRHQVIVYGPSDEILGGWEAFSGSTLVSLIGSFPASPPDININDATVTVMEGTGGTSDATFTVALSAPSNHKVAVSYATGSDTASGGSDFTTVSGRLTFDPGETVKTVTVPIDGDSTDEFDETFKLNLFNPSVGILKRSQSTCIILDDDPPPAASAEDASVTEGDSGTRTVRGNVTLAIASAKTVTLNFSTADGTATAGSDYVAASGSLTFNPGEVTKSVTVMVRGDAVVEGDETFFLNLSEPSNATFARAQAVYTITDDDPKVRFSSTSLTVKEGVNRSAVITVERTGDVSGPMTVQYETISNSAFDRWDFTAASGTLRFASGESSKNVPVLITDDAFAESTESFFVRLHNPTGGFLGTPSFMSVFVEDNDASDGPSPVRGDSFDTDFFVRQHYADFLNREPDPQGLAFWKNQIDECTNEQCKEVRRINVSAAFFLSIEFQQTGYFVYLLQQAAFGVGERLPQGTFLADTREIGRGVVVGAQGWEQKLAANKQAFADEFVERPQFLAQYPQTLTAAQYIDALLANTGDPRNPAAGAALSQAERDQLISRLSSGAATRAQVLQTVAENAEFQRRQFNKAFVLMQYFGYLRRSPNDTPDTDFSGYDFWLGKLNQFNGNFINAEMVKAFISSIEYRGRFGTP